jgi:hypothetical protein
MAHNPPFIPVKFAAGPPVKPHVREDGPGAFVNPVETGPPVYYGLTQTTAIVNVAPKPPRHTAPGAAPPSLSKIP